MPVPDTALPPLQITERQWQVVIGMLSAAVILITVWCLTHGITIIFMHLYYFPIVLLAYRYRWTGFRLASLLALLYLLLVIVYNPGQIDVITGAGYRFLVFLGVAATVSLLSDQLSRSQEDLQREKEISGRYLSLAPALILALDQEGRITLLNRYGREILECGEEDVTGLSWPETFIPVTNRENIHSIISTLNEGDLSRFTMNENEILTRKGNTRTIRFYNTLIRDSAGRIQGTLSYGADITDEKRAQEDLRALQQFQENVIANANIWITVLGPDGTILVWNDAAEQISGYKKTDVVGKRSIWRQLYPNPEYRRNVTTDIRRIIRRESLLEDFETVIRCADGSPRTIVWNTREMIGAGGAVTSIIAIGRDVTAQRSAEMRAGESEKRFQHLFSTIQEGFAYCRMVYDDEGKPADFIYLAVNPAFDRIIGVHTVTGKPITQVFPGIEKEFPQIFEIYGRVARTGVPESFEIDFLPVKKWLNISVYSPEKDHFVAVFSDITERKRAEASLVESESFNRGLVENLPEYLCVYGPDGRILFVNPASATALGYDTEELAGTHVLSYIPEEYHALVTAKMKARMQGDTSSYEIALVAKDGTRRSVLVKAAPIQYRNTPAILLLLVDVTDRKREEDTLRRTNAVLTTQQETSPDGILVVNEAGKIILFNTRFAQIWNIPADILTTRDDDRLLAVVIRQIVNPDEFLSRVRYLYEHREEKSYEEIRLSDGRALERYSAPMLGKDGEYYGRIWYFHDITERKRAEEALQKSEEKFRIIATYTFDWEYWIAPDDTFVYMSPSCERITGYPPGDFYARPALFSEIIHPDDQETYARHRDVTQHSDDPEWVQFRIIRKDGRIRWISHSCQPMFSSDGTLLGRRSSNRDITERKEAEIALKENEEKYRAFFTTSRDCVFITTLDGRWVDFNNAAVDLFGYDSREDLMRVRIPDIYADSKERDSHIRYIQENGYSFEYPVDLKKKDGTVISTLITTVARKDASGTIIGFQGSVRDITERKRMEMLLQQNRRKLAEAMDLAKLVDWEFDVATGMFTFDDRFYAFYGTTADREGGNLMSAEAYAREFVHPDDQGMVAEAVKGAIETTDPGYTRQVEHRIIRRDGEVRHIVVRFGITKDVHGRTIKTHGANQDITERKQAEEELFESREHYRAIIENSQLAIAVLDTNFQIISVNAMFSKLFHKPTEEFVAKYCYNEFEKRGSVCLHCPGKRAMISLNPEEIETEGVRDDGTRFYARNRAVPFFRPDGSVGGFVEMVEDITERRKAEEEREKIRQWQEGLNRILAAVLAPATLDEKLKIVTDGVVGTFGADFCRIWLIGKGDRCDARCMHADVTEGPHICRYRDRCLHLWASSGRYTHLDGKAHRRVPFGAYKIGRIASGEEDRFLTNDVQHDPRVHDHAWAEDLGLVGFAGYQLRPPEGDVLGVFALFTRFPITPDMDALLEVLSRAVSMVIQKDNSDLALEESEALLGEVGRIAQIGGWELDLATQKVHWTDETYRIHDLPPQSPVNLEDAVQFFDEPDRGRLEAAIQRCTESGEPYDLELPFTSATGRHLWTRAIGTAVRENSRIVKLTGTFQDITQLRKTQAALRSSEGRLHTLIRTIPDLIWLKDSEGVYLSCNTTFERFFGAKEAEIVGKTDYDFVDRALADFFRENDKRAMAAGGAASNEEWITFADDGHRALLETTKTPVYDDQGTLIGVLGIGRDITQRKQFEEDLRISRQLFADIISFLPDPTFVIDREGKVLAWNRALEQLSGVPAEDILGRGDYEYSLWVYGRRRPILIDLVLHPDLDAARLNYYNIRREGSTLMAETSAALPSGKTVTLSLVTSPLVDETGVVTGAIESMRDITVIKKTEADLARLNANLEQIVKDRTRALEDEIVQRKYAEQEVHTALAYNRSVIEANPDLMVVLDMEGRILDINSAGEKLTGIPVSQLIGKPYFGYLEDDGTLSTAFARLIAEGSIENNVRIRQTDGHRTPLSVHATVVKGIGGAGDRIIVSAHDITKQKADEEAIRASLEEKVILLREIHHRVKNNLQIIISLTNLQMRKTGDPEVKQIMAETQNRVRAMSLVHEKLYRSTSLSQIDFADYTRFLATQLMSFYTTDSRRVHLEITLKKVMVDINTAVPLGLIMNELVSNALKHAFPGNREGTIRISGGVDENVLRLVVEDDGIGMPAGLDWRESGTLGMRLITSLADQIDSAITVTSGPGTTISLTLAVSAPPGDSGV